MSRIALATLLGVGCALALSGCQTVEQSQYDAEQFCINAGQHPGTHSFDRCVAATYAQNRANADAAAGAVAAGVVTGAVVGAAVAAPYGYGYGYGYHPYYGGYYGGWRH